jgi:ketosteroid isomerase-like protein
MPAGQPMLKGRAAIEQYYREFFQGPVKVKAFTFTHLESTVAGDTGYDVGTSKQTLAVGPGQAVHDSGKYSVILKRTGGEWKIAYLIYNSDFPPKMPAAATASR